MIKKIIDRFMKDFSLLGGTLFYLILSSAILSLKETKLFFILILNLILAMVLIVLIRLVYYKERPKKQGFKNILEKIDSSSFPSMHAWRVGMIFTSFYLYYPHLIVTSIFLLIAAIFVCISRVYLKRHYIIDVVVGFLAGILQAFVISRIM